MANDQGVRYGAFPVYANDSPPKLLYFKANTAVNIFRGQFVALNNSGQLAIIAPGDNIASLGIAWEFLDPNNAGLPSTMTTTSAGAFLPSGTDAIVGVTYDPYQLYLMEEITGGTAITANSVGKLVDFTYIASTGNTNTGYANTVIDNSTLNVGTGPLLQILNLYNIQNQDGTINAAGNAAKWVVRIANHQLFGTKLSVPLG